MDTASIHRGLLTIVLMSIVTYTQAIKIGFGEIDYYAYEHNGSVQITVQLMGINYGDVPIVVQTRTYEQVDQANWPMLQEELPDPAEYELEGRQDFINETFRYVFKKSTKLIKEKNFPVKFNDDRIDEHQEGFFVELKVDESKLLPKDRDNMVYIRRGIALIRIQDDDEIKLSFSEPSYTVSEDAGKQANLIAVVKEDNRTTEKTLKLMVYVSRFSEAKRGEDYTIMDQSLNLTFAPDEQIKYIPFEVIDDSIVEKRESFSLYMSIPVNTELYQLGTIQNTVVYIDEYTCTEDKNIYFAIDTTTSNPRDSLCQTIFGIQLMTAAIDLTSTRIGSVLYPTATANMHPIPDPYNIFSVGTPCTDIVNKSHTLVKGFSDSQTSNPYHQYIHGAGSYPVKTLEYITQIILDEIEADSTLAGRRRIVVFVTDGGDDGKNSNQLMEASLNLTNIPGVTIIVAGNLKLTNDPAKKAEQEMNLKTIAGGKSSNVVNKDNGLDLAVALVEKLANITAICEDEAETITKKLKSGSSRAYCSCVSASAPNSGFLEERNCRKYCCEKQCCEKHCSEIDCREETCKYCKKYCRNLDKYTESAEMCKTPPTCGQI